MKTKHFMLGGAVGLIAIDQLAKTLAGEPLRTAGTKPFIVSGLAVAVLLAAAAYVLLCVWLWARLSLLLGRREEDS
jgi:hypothetical protein